MKYLKSTTAALAFTALLFLSACNNGTQKNEGSEGSGSKTETTPNDSSGAESTKAMGVDGDNQNDVPGYPSNQSNLNSDSTQHSPDTLMRKKN
jgi:hypothetical protein